MKTTLETSEDRTVKQRRSFAGQETAADMGLHQDALSQRIAASPVMTAQRKAIDRMTAQAEPVQKLSPEEDEELMQGKFAAQLQGPEEEEELLQGAFEAVEPRTGTSDTSQ
jgi:hypothetical protein